MAKFLMLGKYSVEAIKGLSKERTSKATEIIQKAGGKINSMYALLGNYDLAFIVEFAGIADAIKTSVSLTKLTGVGFTTLPALSVEEFDNITG